MLRSLFVRKIRLALKIQGRGSEFLGSERTEIWQIYKFILINLSKLGHVKLISADINDSEILTMNINAKYELYLKIYLEMINCEIQGDIGWRSIKTLDQRSTFWSILHTNMVIWRFGYRFLNKMSDKWCYNPELCPVIRRRGSHFKNSSQKIQSKWAINDVETIRYKNF